MNHHLRTRLAVIVAGAAVIAIAGAGLSGVMATGHETPAPAAIGPSLPVPAPLGPGPSPVDRVLPAPDPLALHAAEVNDWVDRVVADAADAAPAQADDPWAVIDRCVLADMAGDPDSPADDNSAASIAVAVDGVITYTKGYGVRDPQGGAVDANTLFRIGSTTKMMTAAAIMQLSEQGKVRLDAPLPSYLPEYRLGHPWRSEDLTLHRLLSHQSGIIDQYFVIDEVTPLSTWVQTVGAYSLPLYAAPGSYWNYANPNFSLAGAVVERESGLPYAQYMSQKLWDPSGMPLTTVDPTEVISTGDYAIGYHGGQPIGPTDMFYPALTPAGNAFSTPTELVTWALALQSGKDGTLSAASKALMQTRHVSMGYAPWMDYGYGVMITDWRDKADPTKRVVVYDHGGNIYGGSSQLFWIPERGVVISILSNTIRSLGSAAACAVDTLAGIEPIPEDETKIPPDQWDPFTGTYSMMDLMLWPWTANVTRVSNTLAVDFTDVPGGALIMGRDIRMQYAFADLFVAFADSLVTPGSPIDFSFIRDPGDRSRVRYMRNRNLVGQRVGDFPARVAVAGESCVPFTVTAGLDMPVLRIATAGLVTPTHLVSVPLTADNPSDPSSATIKLGFTVGEGGASWAYALADTEPDDAAGVYLVGDLDGDGAFAFPTEVIARPINAFGASLAYASDPLPAGRYQLWVQGIVVQGENSVVNIDLTVMQGSQLRLENRPRGLSDGVTWRMQVCADHVEGLTEPAIGMIEYSYDSPPRVFRTMIDWQPGATPQVPVIYLPLDMKGYQIP
jgi:D-alanyl-D-alanine carboxypeptidase